MLLLVYSFLFALALLSGAMVVFSRHAVYSALFLVLAMISIAGIFILIDAQLAAALQILVYAGAIMVLFLFVIMLLNLGRAPRLPMSTRGIRRGGALLFALFLAQSSLLALRLGSELTREPAQARSISAGEAALTLLTRYLYAFEMTSVMLLIAVVGAMVLARRRLAPLPPGRESRR